MQFNSQVLFPKTPTIHIEPEASMCSCQSTLKVVKTKTREVCTRHIGPFFVHETIKWCPLECCGETYRYTELDHLVPQGSRFGYDIVEYIGLALWQESRTVLQIQVDLASQNISISEREIGYLARKFVSYMVESHKDKQNEVRQFLQRGGGYFLYFDSMHPNEGAAHMMCAIAEEILERVSIVLGSVKLPKESTETVAEFLRELKDKYGDPLAGICDMLPSNLAAFKEVFPGVLLLVCHFHFLRGLGKIFLEREKMLLDGFLDQYDINRRLKEIAKNCKTTIEKDGKLSKHLEFDDRLCQPTLKQLPGVVMVYCMVMWILSYKQELNGYGFPFDRANLVYFQRMKNIFAAIKDSPEICQELSELKYFLASFLLDPKLQTTLASMEKKAHDFDRIREIMKIAPEDGGKGLNDDGEECDMTVMENQLKKLIELDEIKNNPDSSYKKVIAQMKKYWGMLFAKPVEAVLPNGESTLIYPQRTSNCMERLFREFQQRECKRTGMQTLGRTVRAMIAETPMMKNLQCPEYMEIILNGKPTLAARFAELERERMVRKNAWSPSSEEKIPLGIKKIIRIPNFFKIYMNNFRIAQKAA